MIIRQVRLCGITPLPKEPKPEKPPRVCKGEDKQKSYERRYRWARNNRAKINAARRAKYVSRKAA